MPDEVASASSTTLHTAAIGLGSNLGDREAHLRTAIDRLALLGSIIAVSSLHDTAPVGFLAQPRFLNAAVLVNTSLTASALLDRLLAIELAMGRDRASVAPKGPRTIDLDLLFFDTTELSTPALTLPHPAMHERAFVLAPLAEIAPAWNHPGLGRSVAEMLANLC